MPKLEKKDISFNSSDGHSIVSGHIYMDHSMEPYCIMQISHGMCEYIGRYDHFATYMAMNGIIVCGNDHIGHGSTAASDEDLGYFSEHNGRNYVLLDLKKMNQMIREMYPGLPVVMLGHSMGSFFARRFAVEWPELLDGLILSGTGGPNKQVDMGIMLARRTGILFGDTRRSYMLHMMTFGSYMKRIKNPQTSYDWVSRDKNVVEQYKNDPLCTFRFTANGFHELYSILKDVSSLEWAKRLRKDMPVMIFSGQEDPVGDYGKGVDHVRKWLSTAGVRDIVYKLYPGGRHEMINETNKGEVYLDVFNFIRKHWKKEPDCE